MLKTGTLAAAVMAAAALGADEALAAFPERTVTIIVGAGPGSGSDVAARTYLPFLEKCLGGTVAIVNRPGAGGALAYGELMASEPDGYTYSNVDMPNVAAQAIVDQAAPPYETIDYVANLTSSRVGLNVKKDSEFQTFQQFVDYAKANPKVLTLGLSSLGGDDQLTQLLVMKAAGFEMTIVPFGDGGSSRAALIGGHVAAASMSDGEAAGFLDQVRTLALAAEERSRFLPDVPTLRELGYDVVGGSNQIIGTRKGAPAEAVDKMRACFGTVFTDPAFLAEAEKRTVPIAYMNAADTEAFVREQSAALTELWKSDPWIAK
jgi:tripartite-type tricarboxylate transporter receptor subunit TctC